MASYGITIHETASKKLAALVVGLQAREYVRPMGEAGTLRLKEYFADKNAEAGAHRTAIKLGATPTDLYRLFIDATHWAEDPSGFVLSINHPAVRQRVKGGDIFPVNARNLTIPATAAAYGKRARAVGVPLKFGFAFDEFTQKWRPALLSAENYKRTISKGARAGQVVTAGKLKATSGAHEVFYWLVKKVYQEPDDTVLPDRTTLIDGIVTALKDWVESKLRKS